MVFVVIYFTVFLFYVESRILKKFAEFTNLISMKKTDLSLYECVQFFKRNILFIKINGKNCQQYFPKFSLFITTFSIILRIKRLILKMFFYKMQKNIERAIPFMSV